MGSSASKAAKSAAGQSGRKLPPQVSPSFPRTGAPSSQVNPPTPGPQQYAGPTVQPSSNASTSKTDGMTVEILQSAYINRDASDPAYLSQLHALGTVAPNPFLPLTHQNPSDPQLAKSQAASSQRSPANHAATMLTARRRFQEASAREEAEVGRPSFAGREFLDVLTVQKALAMRNKGVSDGEIERQLKLKKGVAGKVGNGHFAALEMEN
ncbi:hypothetical protein P152DRAFT_388139 [Eremomyces bilateralis CBS 781.70]|uniref:Helix-turn-helix domain-containing protein n=1 Tax=Eremomyces bilateralis CBS 781.70 TaxID=1392243 RepID=A0A6G1GHG5_9PEZI|nr:uncharacterized protein P152DRAFT_388139 [Eremomyces bilateralis CBS 781.70]KAF1817454.1 hypothetical protein P152DRAFT_388139 [Eremomyces bilateralis CBS 781.70]